MSHDFNLLMSVKAAFADSILHGRKTVEVRRRAPRIPSGARLWLYTKAPKAHIEITATVREVVTLDRAKFWEVHGHATAISEDEYRNYIGESVVASAVILSEVRKIHVPITLAEMRSLSVVQPPQFYQRLRPGGLLTRLQDTLCAFG